MKPIYRSPSVEMYCCTLIRLEVWPISTLSAPFWRFYWNADPGAWIEFKERRYDLLPGDFFLIPPNTPGEPHVDQPVGHLYMHFSTQEPYASIAPEIFHYPLTRDIQNLVTGLVGGIKRQQNDSQHFRMKALALIHLALTRIPANRLLPHRADDRIDRVLEHITTHLAAGLSNANLARIAGLHTNAFTRLFRNVVGESPQRYINTKRIDRACTMLHNTAISMEEAAASLGFCDRYHFSRVFKQRRGIGPAAFQRSLRTVAQPSR